MRGSRRRWPRSPGSDARARYLFRTGRAGRRRAAQQLGLGVRRAGVDPGRRRRDQWYLHLFDTAQPDLDWRNPEVAATVRRRAPVLAGPRRRRLPDRRRPRPGTRRRACRDQRDHSRGGGRRQGRRRDGRVRRTVDEPMWDQPGVHEIYRRWRRILDEYDGDRMAVAEAWTRTAGGDGPLRARPDELHQAFNFHWLVADWSATRPRPGDRRDPGRARRRSAASRPGCSATTTSPGTRRGTAAARSAWPGPGPRRWCCWRCPARRTSTRARSSASRRSTCPRAPAGPVLVPHRRSPAGTAAGCRSRGRATAPPYGFGPGSGQPWIPQPDDWAPLTVAAQEADPDVDAGRSTAGRWPSRREHAAALGRRGRAVEVVGDVLTLRRGTLTVVLNCGSTPVPMPPGELLIASSAVGRPVPPDTAVWVRTSLSARVVAGQLARRSRSARRSDQSPSCSASHLRRWSATSFIRREPSSVTDSSVARPSSGSGVRSTRPSSIRCWT